MVLGNAVNASQTGFQSLNAATGAWNGRTLTPGSGISITNQDGTGGNPVITSTGMTPDPFGTVYIVDDFIYMTSGSSPTGNMNWTMAGGNIISGTAANPGQVQIGQSGGGGAGSIVMGNDNAAWPFVLGGGALTGEFLVNIATTNNAVTFIGFGAGTKTSEPTSGVYFFYASGTNSGQWVGKTANASSRSSANSTVAIVGNTWVRLKIVINAAGTSASFFVNGVEISNSPLATNLPTLPIDVRVGTTSVVAQSNLINIDLVTITNVLTVSR